MKILGVMLLGLGLLLLARIGKTLRTDAFASALYDKSYIGCFLVLLAMGMALAGLIILFRAS